MENIYIWGLKLVMRQRGSGVKIEINVEKSNRNSRFIFPCKMKTKIYFYKQK